MNRKFSGIHLCRGQTRDNRHFYAYMNIAPERLEEMSCLINNGQSLDLTEFGDVLHADWGENPHAEIHAHMKESHGEICDWKEMSKE